MILRILAAVAVHLATPATLLAQEAGRGAMRPYVHVLLAYAAVWLLILLWVWTIARRLKVLGDAAKPDGG